MQTICLDGITSQYLVESGVSKSMSLSAWQPGGQRFTDAEGLRWFVNHNLKLSVTYDGRVQAGSTSLVIPVDSDGINADTMRVLLDTEVVYQGRTYVFDHVSAEAEEEWQLGCDTPGISRWLEVNFKVR